MFRLSSFLHHKPRTRHGRPGRAVLAAAMLAGLVVTACSSTSPPSTPPSQASQSLSQPATTTDQASPQPDSTEASATESGGTSADGLTYIGTFTVASPGASITTKVSVGPPTPNTQAKPSVDVLEACNWNYTTTIAQAVFIHGSLTISYTGSLPQNVFIGQPTMLVLTDKLLLGAGLEGSVGIQGPDGSWNSCGTGHDWAYVLQPGSTVTADMWINYPVLSNAHPTFTAAQQAPLAIQFAAGGSVTSVSGPQAANCSIDGNDSTPTLLLYSTPPYNFQAQDVYSGNHRGSCTAA